MTEKRIKAWAIIDKRGNLVRDLHGVEYLGPIIWKSKKYAKQDLCDEAERVVPVEIVYKEGR